MRLPAIAALLFGTSAFAQMDFASVTPEEMHYAFMRFDHLLKTNPPSLPRRLEINKAFDAATKLTQAGQLSKAIAAMNELSITLLPAEMDASDRDSYRVMWSLATQIVPAEVRTTTPDAAIVLRGMYPVSATSPVLWTEIAPLDISALQVKPVRHKIRIPGSGPLELTLPLKDIISNRQDVSILFSFSADEIVETRRFLISQTDPSSFAAPYAAKVKALDQVAGKDPGFERAKAIYVERLKILSGTHSSTNSAQYLLDSKQHTRHVYHELKLLTSGLNPYRNLSGETWRPIITKGAPVPCRVYAPADLPQDAAARVIIAIGDSGSDETTFLHAHGEGEIKRIADEQHLIIASPSIDSLRSNSSALGDLISQLSEDFKIDRSRVYVIGHGKGADLATSFAKDQKGVVAGVVCFAGGDFSGTQTPTLVFSGKADTLVPWETLAKKVSAAKNAHSPIEFRPTDGEGHTLIVAAKLRDASDWLLTRSVSK